METEIDLDTVLAGLNKEDSRAVEIMLLAQGPAPVPVLPPQWILINMQTGAQVGGPYNTRNRGLRSLDKKDNEHGGYIHKLVPIGEHK